MEFDVTYITENAKGSDLQVDELGKALAKDETRKVHFAAKVEKDLVEKETKIKLVIKVHKNEYVYNIELVKDKEDVKSEGARIYNVR